MYFICGLGPTDRGQLSEELSRSVFFLDYLGEWLWILGGWYPLHLWWA